MTQTTTSSTVAAELAKISGLSLGENSIVNVKITLIGVALPSSVVKGAYLEQEFTYSWNHDGSGTPNVFTLISSSTLIVRSNIGSPTLVESAYTSDLYFNIMAGTTDSTKWSGVIEYSTILNN